MYKYLKMKCKNENGKMKSKTQEHRNAAHCLHITNVGKLNLVKPIWILIVQLKEFASEMRKS